MTRLLLVLVALGVALAGCAAPSDAPGTGATTPTPATSLEAPATDDEAQGLVRQALAELPERYGFRMDATRNGNPILDAQGAFDDATGASHVTLRGSPAVFGGIRAFAQGVSIYTSQEGAVYRFGDLALVQASAAEELSGLVPAALFTPDAVLGQVGDNLTVTSVQATEWEGRPAIAVGVRIVDGDAPAATGTVTLLREDPPRIVRLEAQMPEDRSAGPLSGASVKVDLLYGDDALPVPEDARRLVALGHEVDAADPGGNQTWTFLAPESLPLDGLEVRVQDLAEAGNDPTQAPTRLALPLSEGEAEQDGVRVTFEDADGSGTLTAGDRLDVTVSEDAAYAPQVLLHDAQTGAYVTADFLVVFQTLFRF